MKIHFENKREKILYHLLGGIVILFVLGEIAESFGRSVAQSMF